MRTQREGAGKFSWLEKMRHAGSAMSFEETQNVIMIADHVKVKQTMIGGEDQAHGKPVAAFVKPPPENASARTAMCMRIPKGLAHRFDQVSDRFPLRF